jgi:hypothetical protein
MPVEKPQVVASQVARIWLAQRRLSQERTIVGRQAVEAAAAGVGARN